MLNFATGLTPTSNEGSHDASQKPAGVPSPAARRDADLLDAYSQAVIGVVSRVGPAVISVAGHPSDGERGQGSGFLITPDGFALTNSHVARGRPRLRALTEEG